MRKAANDKIQRDPARVSALAGKEKAHELNNNPPPFAVYIPRTLSRLVKSFEQVLHSLDICT